MAAFYSRTSTGGNIIWNGDMDFIADGNVQFTANTDWVGFTINKFLKRRRFLGKKENGTDEDSIAVFKLIKTGLTKTQKEKFKKLAEQAYRWALKYQDAGQTEISKKFEEKMNDFLKQAAVETAGYELFIKEEQVEKYRDNLPSNKELIIDTLDEYDQMPVPPDVLEKVKKAKDWSVFDSFCVFWIREIKDPIVFGQIKERPDMFYFIGEWDDDIKIDDLLKLI